MNPSSDEIRSAPCPTCAVCGKDGVPLYNNLRDRLFTAPGEWNLKTCINEECGLIWPDPMPQPEEIGKAYATYYTHASQEDPAREGWKTRLRRAMEHCYWSRYFGYPSPPPNSWARLLAPLYYLSPLHRREAEAGVRGLAALPRARLFDVGCGSGDWLLTMRRLGWEVAGNDFDANATKVGSERGLAIGLGSLEDQNLPTDELDAITLSHVIEHVPDPLQTLRECYRVLKPGGKIVVLTPNCGSLSHHYFKSDWRGLEPPRHLHVFSLKSMDRLLQQVGFENRSVRPFIVTSVIYDSLQLKWGGSRADQKPKHHTLARILAELFKFVELCLVSFKPIVGDCIFAIAVKPERPLP